MGLFIKGWRLGLQKAFLWRGLAGLSRLFLHGVIRFERLRRKGNPGLVIGCRCRRGDGDRVWDIPYWSTGDDCARQEEGDDFDRKSARLARSSKVR